MASRVVNAGLLVAGLALLGCGGTAPAQGAPPSSALLSTALHRVVRCLEPERGPFEVQRDQDLVVLVHGCNSSIAKFKNLAEVFRSRGQQAACFTYDDRDSLISVADELNVALDALHHELGTGRITVVGHSQGGLIARQASTAVDKSPAQVTQLVTISTPFSGIHSARDCGFLPLHIFTFGITVGVCQIIAGRKWTEIHDRAPFMLRPPPLAPEVARHLAVMTDETGSCLDQQGPSCGHDDFIFSLQEQALNYVNETRVEPLVVRSGHTEIVGEGGRVPVVLISVLEAEGILRPSPAAGLAERQALLERIYRGEAEISGAISCCEEWTSGGKARARHSSL